jgi:signal transduction histidine kinase
MEIMISVFTAGYTPWHYISAVRAEENGVVYLAKVYGPHHTLYTVTLIISMLIPMAIVIWAFINRKKVSWIYALLLALMELLTVVIYFGERYVGLRAEFLPYAYAFDEIVILYILKRAAIYDVNANVELSFANTDDHGYVILSATRKYMGSDEVARMYFPEVNNLEIDCEIKDPFLRDEFGDWILESREHSVPPKLYERCGDIVKVTVRPFYAKDGRKNLGFILQIVDDSETQKYISRLKESKEFAEDMAKRADAANKSKSEFLAGISHEIRTPINAVLGFDEMIIRESTEEKIKNYAVDIKKSGTTMLGLINDLLDLSKIESGKMELVPTNFNLVVLLNEVINMTSVRAQDKGLDFKIEIDNSIPKNLYGDEVRLKQIMVNILTNAVKYTETGTVTLIMNYRKVSLDKINLYVAVADTGIGMKEDTIKQLFEPYQRIDEVKNRYIEGTGLGMSITHKLLALMNSNLDVMSVYGEGSRFSFEVELSVVGDEVIGNLEDSFRELHESLKEYKASFTAPDAQVLIVDDTKVNIKIFKGLLKHTLVKIDEALSGMEAIELTRLKKYDVIFIDHMMPNMDGIETFRAIKSEEDNLNHYTPMIMLTANVSSNSREYYSSVGFDDFMGKPIDPILLEAMLKRFL